MTGFKNYKQKPKMYKDYLKEANAKGQVDDEDMEYYSKKNDKLSKYDL